MLWDSLLSIKPPVTLTDQWTHLLSSLPDTLKDRKVAIALGATTVIISSYSYIRFYRYKYWKSLGVDGPTPTVPLGNLYQVMFDPLKNLIKWQEEFGPTYGTYFMTTPVLVTGDIDVLREIFVNDNFYDRLTIRGHPAIEQNIINKNGLEWRRDRSILSPSFTSGKMKQMFPLIEECVNKYLPHVQKWSLSKESISPKEMYTKLTSMIIARCAFATQVDAFAETDQHPLMKHLMNLVTPNLLTILIFVLTPDILRSKLKLHASPRQSFAYLVSLLERIMKERKESPAANDFPDLLQLLLNTQSNDQGFTDDQVIANSFLFFVAGLETTAATLTFLSYLLALHPHVQDELYRELADAHEVEATFTYETLFRLKYLEAVINETLRLYSPAPQVSRIAREDYTLCNDIKVRAGTFILIPIDAVHHNEQYHPQAHVFDPTRFLPENKQNMPHGSWIPFLNGPRNCIGMRFAQLVLKSVVAHTVLRYEFVKGPDTPDQTALRDESFMSRLAKAKVLTRERTNNQ